MWGFFGFVPGGVETGLDLGAIEAELLGLGEIVCGEAGELLLFGEGFAGGADESATAVLGGDDAFFVEDAIGTGDGVEVDVELVGKLAHSGELLSGGERPNGELVFEIINDLLIDGFVGEGVDFNHFFSRFSFVCAEVIVLLYLCIIV